MKRGEGKGEEEDCIQCAGGGKVEVQGMRVRQWDGVKRKGKSGPRRSEPRGLTERLESRLQLARESVRRNP